MRRTRTHRRFLLLPALAWLIVQISMAGGFAAAAPQSLEQGGQTAWICTGGGMRLVSLDAGGIVSDEAMEGSASASGCYWCQAFAAAVSPGGPAAMDLAQALGGPGSVFRVAPDKVLSLRTSAFHSRAPPLEFQA